MFGNKKEQNNFVSPFKGSNFSTSKIAILFAFIIATAWGSVLAYFFLNFSCHFHCYLYEWQIVVLSVLLSGGAIIGFTSLFGLTESHLLWSNTKPLKDLEIEQ